VQQGLWATSFGEFPQIERFIQAAGHKDLPVVVGQGMIYIQLAYYGSSYTTNRLVYLTDESKEVSAEGNSTVVKGMLVLREYLPLQVTDYSEFTASHREFLLYSEGSEWALSSLSRDAGSVRILSQEGGGRMYLVNMDSGVRSDRTGH
jgi:uncharacterized membrane protein